MRKSTLEKTRDQERAAAQTVTVQGWDGMHALLLNGNKGPVNPTQRELLYAPEEYLAYLGVVGAAKTSAGCSLMWMLLLFEPGYQALICRKDYNDLKNTTKKRMEEMLHRLPKGTLMDRDKSAPETWYIRPIAQQESNAGFKPSIAMFMGLHERPAGYEAHGAFIDEADEVPEQPLNEVHSRCRLTGKTRKIVITFNPTDEDHFLYRDCTGLNADGTPVTDPETGEAKGPVYRVLVPKPNENSANLVGGYYNSLRRSMPPDMVARLIEGKWGSSLKGEPVYGRQFSRDFHVRGDLQYNPYEPLYLGHDFGYRKPFTFWAQLSQATGQLRVLWEDMGENEEIHERAPRMMALTRMYMTHGGRTPSNEVIHWGDPAAKQHKDTGSTLAVLNQNGIQLHFLENIGIDPGIRAVRHLLTRTVGRGEPALVIHSRCRVLIRALEAGYRYPEAGSKADPTKPLKGNGYDDPCLAPSTLIDTPTGQVPLAVLRVGDEVTTLDGPGTVSAVRCTSPSTKCFVLSVLGRRVTVTGNHPVLTQRGWIRVDALSYGDYVVAHGPNRHQQEVPGVRWEEVLPVRPVLLDSHQQEQADSASSCGHREVLGEPHPSGDARPPQERGHYRQSAEQSGDAHEQGAQLSAYEEAGAGGSQSASSVNQGHPSFQGLAQEPRGTEVASGAWQGMLGEEAALLEALRHLRPDLRDQAELGQVLLAELQGQGFQATQSWVLREGGLSEVWNLEVTPQHHYVAEGVVVHNCDALRYLVVGLFGPVYDPRDHQTPRQAARTGQNVVLTPSGTPWSHEQNQVVLQGGHDFGESAEYRPDADPMNRWRR